MDERTVEETKASLKGPISELLHNRGQKTGADRIRELEDAMQRLGAVAKMIQSDGFEEWRAELIASAQVDTGFLYRHDLFSESGVEKVLAELRQKRALLSIAEDVRAAFQRMSEAARDEYRALHQGQ